MPTKEKNNDGALPKLKVFASGDGAHCGLADLYPNKLRALKRALKRQKPFDTGWYSSKKEIASARVYSVDGKEVLVEVSVSDDFDTEGMGSAMAFGAAPVNIDSVQQAIYRAWDEAEQSQKDNRVYAGFSVHRNIVSPTSDKRIIWREAWVETFLIDVTGLGTDSPPGDNYHKWGFQGEEKIPLKHQDALERWANEHVAGVAKGKSFTSGKWTIKPFEGDQD